MNRFQATFETAGPRGLFMPFFMLGDPTLETSKRLIQAALDAGADGLELGIPFSDPIADGPVIQAASIRAARAGATVDRCFELIADIRAATDVPIGLLVYYNLVHHRGADAFCRTASRAGADALLAADLPHDQDSPLHNAMADNGLGSVYLVSQNTPDDRAASIMRRATAYTYAVGIMGTTGARSAISDTTQDFIRRLKGVGDTPFVVGFGVGSPQQVVDILAMGAHGVIVGSALIERIAAHGADAERGIEEVRTFVSKVQALRERKQCSS